MRTIVQLSLLLSALAAGPWPAKADWVRIQLSDGTQLCEESVSHARYKPSYQGKADVTKICTDEKVFISWLGTAEAQPLIASYHGTFPSGINVGSGPPQAPGLSAPWLQADVGSVPVAGTASDTQNILTTQGSGLIHRDTSAYHLVYQQVTGDYRLDFTMTSTTGADEYRYCGPFITDSLVADEKWALLAPFLPTGKVNFTGRTATGVGINENPGNASSADWAPGQVLRVEKIGSTMTGYVSYNGGSTFTTIGSTNWTPTGTIFIGVVSSSGLASTLATCTGTMPILTSLSSSGPGNVNFVANNNGGTAAADSFSEDAGTDIVCVARSVDTSGIVGVQVQNAGTGTAVAGTDFTNVFPYVLSWMSGQGGNQCASIPILNRAGAQAPRTLNTVLGAASGGVTIGPTQTTHTTTITDSGATKTAKGYWLLQENCSIGTNGNCTPAFFSTLISNEVCPNANIQGLRVQATQSMMELDTINTFTGSSTRGFGFWDNIVNQLAACGKKLDIVMLLYTNGYNPSTLCPDFYSCYLFAPNFASPGTCTPDPNCMYGVDGTTSGGSTARVWTTNIRDRQVAIEAAYCTRYEGNPTVYGVSTLYDSNNYHTTQQQYDLVQNALFIATAHRSACPTSNISLGMTFLATQDNSVGAQIVANVIANDVDLIGTDVKLPGNGGVIGASWADAYFLGYTWNSGSNSWTLTGSSLLGVQRRTSAIEQPDICGQYGNHHASEIMAFLRDGGDGVQPLRPSRVLVPYVTYCPAGYGWDDWKTYINSTSGQLYNDGRDTTLRTPASLNTTWCETGMKCQ